MSNVSTNTPPAVQAGVPSKSTPPTGSKRKERDEDVDVDGTSQTTNSQPDRPLKKARSPSYKPSSQNVKKATPSVLGKRQRTEDLDSTEGLSSDDTAKVDSPSRKKARLPQARVSNNTEERKAVDGANLKQQEQKVAQEKEKEVARSRQVARETAETQEKARAAKIAFRKRALGIEEPEPDEPLPSKDEDPHRALPPVRGYIRRPLNRIFFARTDGDSDHPRQTPINRRVNFHKNDQIRDPSLYRNPLPSTTGLSLREVHESLARQRAANEAELQADLKAIRAAQEKSERQKQRMVEPVLQRVSEEEEMLEITNSTSASTRSRPAENASGETTSKSGLKKESSIGKKLENRNTNTLVPAGSNANIAGTATAPIDLDDDTGTRVSGDSSAAQMTDLEQAAKSKEEEAKKVKRAEAAQKKKDRMAKIASWAAQP